VIVFDQLGHALRQLRLTRGLNQKELAKAAAITGPMLSAYENGKTNPEVKTLDKILDGLGASLADLDWALRLVNKKQTRGEGPAEKGRPGRWPTGVPRVDGLTSGSDPSTPLPHALEEGYSEIVHGLLRINRFIFESMAHTTPHPHATPTPDNDPTNQD